jgi:glycogen operon protein
VLHGSELKDIEWFTADGTAMTDEQWRSSEQTLAVFLNGEQIPNRGRRGERIVDDSFLLLLNGDANQVTSRLPGEPWAKEYELEVDTELGFVRPRGVDAASITAGEELPMAARSIVMLRKTA